MADIGRRSAAAAVALVALAASLLQPQVSAAPAGSPNPIEQWVAEADESFAYWAQRAGTPEELIDALQLSAPGQRFIINLPWGDMTGDGRDDVIAVDLDGGPGGLGLAGFDTRLTALDGRTGGALWRRELKEQLAFPIEVRLGRKALFGALVASHDYETDTTTFLGIDHRGRTAYEHVFASENTLDGAELTGREAVISFGLFDALRGRATDVLVGVADVRKVPEIHPGVPSIVGLTRTFVIDGRSSELVAHSEAEVGVGRVPYPLTGPAIDKADDLDDVVVTYVLADVEYDEESGLPLLPEVESEFVRARRGTDGTKLWTSDALDLAEGWESPPLLVRSDLGDATRDGRDEVLLHYDSWGYIRPDFEFVLPDEDGHGLWSLNGRNGSLLWRRAARSPTVVGDVDRDRRKDLVATVDVSSGRRSGTKLLGLSGLDGRRVYGRFFRVRASDDDKVESYLSKAGDLQPDGVADVELTQMLERRVDDGIQWTFLDPWLLSGRTGAPLARRHRHPHISPIRASVDGRGDDLYRWAFRIPASVEVVDGRTRRLLLSAAFDIPLTLPADEDYLIPIAARLNRDRCVDFIGTLANSRSTFAVAIDGGSGKLLWAKRQQGLDLGGPIRQTRRADLNGTC